MSAEHRDSSEEHFSSLLAAYDEALTDGTTPSRDGETDLPPELQRELERDLACAQLLHQALQRPAPAERSGTLPWTRLGRFEIRRELGRGTFGVVYLAYDPQLNREVALKVPRAEVATDTRLRARFEREARAAAGLEHPHIVPVYEVGEVGPVCFIVAAYCPGATLAQWLKQRDRPVPAPEAAAFVATLADAVLHAHTRGVIHRDLKPANILLVSGGVVSGEWSTGRGDTTHHSPLTSQQPRITDFGLAKLLLEQTEAGQTRSETIVGTASYMAPEQASGQSKGIGPAADVYALGAILYELLTGRPPFQAETSLETLMQVRTAEPVPLSRLRLSVPRDLETICLKCLEKEPSRRYPSAEALAEDLRRFLAGKPIHARPVSTWERGRKWAKRRPAVAALLAAVIMVGTAGFAAVTWQWQRTEAARQDLEVSQYFRSIALAQSEWLANNFTQAERLLDECPPHLRGWEWHYVRGLRRGNPPPLRGHTESVMSVAWSPDGRRLASRCFEGPIRLWDADSGKEVLNLPVSRTFFSGLAFSPDGRLLATTGQVAATVDLWDSQTGERVRTLSGRGKGPVVSIAFSPDGRRLAAAFGGTVQVWDLDTGEETIKPFRGHTAGVPSVAFSPDGRLLGTAGGGVDRKVKLWDAQTGQLLRTLEGHTEGVKCVAFSPDGKQLASGSGTMFRGGESEVIVWEAATGRPVHTLRGHTGIVESVAFSRDGRRLASAGYDQLVRIWDLATGQDILTLRGHSDRVSAIAFSPDGRRLVSTSQDKTLRIWDATPLDERPSQEWRTLSGHTGRISCVAFSPDDRLVAFGGADAAVHVWDRAADRVRLLRGHSEHVNRVTFSPDGLRLASASDDGSVKLWEPATGKGVLTLPENGGAVRALAFSPDGRTIACTYEGTAIKLWNAATGTELRTLPKHTLGVRGLAFTGDGRRLVSASWDRTAKVWDVETGREITTLIGHDGRLQNVACDAHSRYVATTGTDGVIMIWDTRTWKPLRTLRGHTGWVWSLVFHPDGRHLASAGNDAVLRVWDAATGEVVQTLHGHTRWIEGVAFSADGKQLASGGWDGTVRIWNPAGKGR